jgi:hypothetical protein
MPPARRSDRRLRAEALAEEAMMHELLAILLQTAPLLLAQIAIIALSRIKALRAARHRQEHRAETGECAHCGRRAPSLVSREYDKWIISSRGWACPACRPSRPKRSAH